MFDSVIWLDVSWLLKTLFIDQDNWHPHHQMYNQSLTHSGIHDGVSAGIYRGIYSNKSRLGKRITGVLLHDYPTFVIMILSLLASTQMVFQGLYLLELRLSQVQQMVICSHLESIQWFTITSEAMQVYAGRQVNRICEVLQFFFQNYKLLYIWYAYTSKMDITNSCS